jgi:hypothetical protein
VALIASNSSRAELAMYDVCASLKTKPAIRNAEYEYNAALIVKCSVETAAVPKHIEATGLTIAQVWNA